jgi:hypothetical protein
MQPALGTRPAPSAPPAQPTSTLAAEDAFGIGRVIGRTFSAWWRHVWIFSLLTLVADLPIILVAALGGFPIPGVSAPSQNPFDQAAAAPPATLPPTFWIAYLATMLLFIVEAGAITRGVVDHLAGKRVSLGAMVETGLRRFFPLLAVGLVCYVICLAGALLLLVPGIWLACALAAAVPAVVVERPGVFGAIGRSFRLTKGKRFSVFVSFLVIFLVAVGVSVSANLVLPSLTASFSPLLGVLVGLAVNVLFGTIVWTFPAVVYHDLRVAKEGVRTAELAAIFE